MNQTPMLNPLPDDIRRLMRDMEHELAERNVANEWLVITHSDPPWKRIAIVHRHIRPAHYTWRDVTDLRRDLTGTVDSMLEELASR